MSLLGSIKSKFSTRSIERLRRLRRPRSLYLLASRTAPISDYAGRDRGNPIDRFYIESFLEQHRSLIRGRVLEVKDNAYTRRFGGAQVTQADVLDINPQNAQATVIADLRNLGPVAADTYDCFILTQTLQYIDDLDAAVAECHRILRPGGSVLVTLPTLGKVEGLETNVAGNFWRFTTHSARYVFAKRFDDLDVRSRGNCLAGMAFWVGLAQEDLPFDRLNHDDPTFPCLVTVRATKAGG
jgi:SAM-dependent methyltransferase